MSVIQEPATAQAAEVLPARDRLTNKLFRGLSTAFAWLAILLVVYIVGVIAVEAVPAIRRDGLNFLTGRVWDRNQDVYGILAPMWGTLYTSVLALIVGTVFGLAVAIFLNEGLLSAAVFNLLKVF